MSRFRISSGVVLDSVELTVGDLERSTAYYTNALGLDLIERNGGRARFGVSGRTLLVLHELPGARPAPESSPGLSHVAPQLPRRSDLGRFARHFLGTHSEARLIDHEVSESCYVVDPDGHTVELTAARPRAEWRWADGLPVLVAHPMELSALTADPEAEAPFEGLAPATELGHVQLKVTDAELEDSEPFYCDVLGFEVGARMGRKFLGVGPGEQRSMIVVTNRFSTADSEPAPEDSAQLLAVNLTLPGTRDLEELAGRLRSADHPAELAEGVLTVQDLSGNTLRFAVASQPGSTTAKTSSDPSQ
ncbi:VOC family protein [Sciscionella sediminilitoris]|uniref:VOC family protein n=1 Tax=Sciscionella sediminilitoris TaxID=1445613 RepID=UPI0007C833B2|nr:VOC family protein [Sciscionella sp. SE31]